jgi:hypothetical protein
MDGVVLMERFTEKLKVVYWYMHVGSPMARKKSSVYVDEELWRRLKKYAMEKGTELSALLEDVIREEFMDHVDKALEELAGSRACELDFEPVKPRMGVISELVKAMRDERADSILGQQRNS